MAAKKQKIIVIVGPTTSGKSELAVRIARACRGEIISADSRQIYRGLNIGSGKVSGTWKKGVFIYKRIPHHLIDAVDPRKEFSAAEYKKRAEVVFGNILMRGRVPIVVGGTGFYVDTLLYDLSLPDVPPNIQLRKRLDKKPATELFAMLQSKDPRRARSIDQHNPRRLIRSLEIVEAIGRVQPLKKRSAYDTLIFGISVPRKELFKKIDRRLEKRLSEGMIQEVMSLVSRGVSHRRMEAFGLEYRFVSRYLRKKLSKKAMVEELRHAIHHYAKRQMTWFTRNKEIVWIKPSQTKKALLLGKAFVK